MDWIKANRLDWSKLNQSRQKLKDRPHQLKDQGVGIQPVKTDWGCISPENSGLWIRCTPRLILEPWCSDLFNGQKCVCPVKTCLPVAPVPLNTWFAYMVTQAQVTHCLDYCNAFCTGLIFSLPELKIHTQRESIKKAWLTAHKTAITLSRVADNSFLQGSCY